MENRNISDLLKQYSEQSQKGTSLAHGEIEAKDACLEMCDCCHTGCLCTAICADCFT